MEFDWNEKKAAKNLSKHRVAFEAVRNFEFATALYEVQFEEGEERFFALGFIGNTLHALVYVERGDVIRVVSLRKADKKEIRYYVQDVKGR